MFKRKAFSNTLLVFVLFISGFAQAQSATETKAPSVIFLDINETLLDLEPMRASVGQALGGRPELLGLWFSTLLHYSLVETSTEQYHDFGTVGTAALMMVAQAHGVQLSEAQARASIVTPITRLPAYADVRPGLQMLKDKGYTLIALTNSSRKVVQAQLSFAGLDDLFTDYLSSDTLKSYKPNLAVYTWAVQQRGITPAEAMLVAAHGWDIAGAQRAGLRSAFVARPGQSLYPLAPAPDYVVSDIKALAQRLPVR
ncbi:MULTISPECIES: haloacid dehalogenase type II [Pseudomonas]|uniref:(S)-2-haloacid dehalogenase n=1 Tax=Pseudomonas gessardii TaxID=78544 RepID=A0ABS9F9W9_9PSED|nr:MULTISPECIES: haloacid dehalogenase type II [Pseudomonas]MBH3423974.1 haloacid dehalogenase type II [Pseudomonas gessardii]MCF4978696.1 haloacid dehalogenase type II [Pseudomonas gessardii]MCF4992060.1 haloacid dehalogenase type II [Pseudomonas gessardii]MCF5086350.1 haloacid dehalogenase type II [Pseudomonas gessardii]MCF5097523.1 haloacid dehalogenase type II [Pseudomonas gessardii]